jgi:hypothetical protein
MKFELVQPEQIQVRESLGLVKGDYDIYSKINQPLTEYQTMLDLVRRDPTLARAFDIIVEFATHRGYDFINGDRKQRDKMRILFDKTLNFKQVLPNLLYSLLYYGDAFLELRKNKSDTPNELFVLETTEMRIKHDIHGKIESFIQRPFALQGMTEIQILDKEQKFGIVFSPEECLHFRMKPIGSNVYSFNPTEPAATYLSTKLYASNYLMNIFINMPPRYVSLLAGASKDDYLKAKVEFQSAKTNYKKTIAFVRSTDPQAKLNIEKLEAPYDKDLLEFMKWLTNEIIAVTGVPRLWLMEAGSENRSAGEAEQRPFDVRIKAIQRNILEPTINLKLLPLLTGEDDPDMEFETSEDSGKPQFKFNEISIKGETEILANLNALIQAGLKNESKAKYLDFMGILGFDADDFEDPMVAQSKDSFPSRQRNDKNTKSMTQNMNERGVSDSSGKKMGISK